MIRAALLSLFYFSSKIYISVEYSFVKPGNYQINTGL